MLFGPLALDIPTRGQTLVNYLYIRVIKFTLMTGLAVCTNSWASNAHAEQKQWFTAGTLSIGAADLHNSSSRGSLGTGQVIGGFVDGRLRNSQEVDAAAGIGASIGFNRSHWSLEAEVLWRVRTDWDLSAPSPSIRTVTNIQTNISNATFMLNLSRRWGNANAWQWQLGGGLGVAFNRFETDYKEREIPGEREEIEITADRRSQQLAWNLSASMSRKLGKRWRGRIRYQYLDLGNIEAGPFVGRDVKVFSRHSTHELQFTLIHLWRR